MSEKLIKNAGSRGLWIGMFPEPQVRLAAAHADLLRLNADMFKEIVETSDLHITIAHLGRSNTARTAEAVLAATEMAASTIFGEHRIGVEGVIRLPSALGLLIVPDRVLVVRNQVGHSLLDRGVKMDRTFAGVPHITVGKLDKRRLESPRCPLIEPFELIYRGLTVACGDERVTIPFSDPPF